MPASKFKLTPQAREDLAHIARYTKKVWGRKQAMKYAGLLDAGFVKIVEGEIFSKPILESRTDIFAYHCEHHYIF